MGRKGLFVNLLLASTLVLVSTLLLAGSAHSQQPAPIPPPETCKILLNRLDDLIAIYTKAADAAIAKEDPAPALERARKAAQKGDTQATVTMAGITIQMRSRAERYTVPTIRQICTLAERNGLPLHLVTCAYLNALNPIGNREEKRAAMLRMIGHLPPPARPCRGLSLLAIRMPSMILITQIYPFARERLPFPRMERVASSIWEQTPPPVRLRLPAPWRSFTRCKTA